ncbi:RICIN domain-containing protein [Streptomyces sp. URMC 124]|uniref:RICIN domain-containing protein n=1 Tax=Streptomyces sp. URMC 124 TaxID=3423405 RepID=UPI003F1E1815
MGNFAEGTYLIRNEATGLYLTVRDQEPATVSQQPKNDAKYQDQQSWVVKQVTAEESEVFAGLYRLQNLKTKLYVHMPRGVLPETLPGRAMDLHGEGTDDRAATYWQLTDEGDGRYGLHSGLSAKSPDSVNNYDLWLGIRNLDRNKDAVLEQYTRLPDRDRAFQYWRFEKPDVPRKEEPRVIGCGGSFDSYLGSTYKGTYQAESIKLPDGTSLIGHQVGTFLDGSEFLPMEKQHLAQKGSDIGRMIGESAAELMAETYDVTARFFLDGNERKVEVTTLKRRPGAKPYTQVTGFALNLAKRPAAVEFTVHTFGPSVSGAVDPYDLNRDFDPTSEEEVRAVDREGRLNEHRLHFAVQAMECNPGSHVPHRLHESRTEDGMQIEIDLRKV